MGNSNKSSLTEFEADWQRKEEEKKREYDDQKLVELGHVLANLLLKNDLILMSRFIEYVFDKRVRSILEAISDMKSHRFENVLIPDRNNLVTLQNNCR